MTATRACWLSVLAAWTGCFATLRLLIPTCLCLAVLCVVHWRALVAEMEEGE